MSKSSQAVQLPDNASDDGRETLDRLTQKAHLPKGAHHSTPRHLSIAGMPIWLFAIMAAVVLLAALTGNLPSGMLPGFAVSMLLGGLLIWLGNLFPIVRDFGLPTVLCTFVPAVLIFYGVMPEAIITVVTDFITTHGFLDFFVAAVIAGSILGAPRALLLKAGPRFAVPLISCIVITFGVIGLIGAVAGFGFWNSMLTVAAPIMAGGLGLGAVPMSEMYGAQTGQDSSAFMGDLMSAVVVANIFCILFAGILNGMGKRKQLFVGFSGNGDLMRVKARGKELANPPKRTVASFMTLGKGLALTAVLYVLGELLGAYLEFLHPYAWMIIAVAALKIFGLLPQDLEEATTDWGELITSVMVPALLVGVSISYISIDEVLVSLGNPMFIVLVVITVMVAGLSSGAVGWLMKFNFVEAAITPGLVMADTGGSGDVSVLSASERMHLMPFAALTNRIGGAFVLFLTTLLVPLMSVS
ncbi:2-hydroxycarboxylate transporter family protein [Glutamicibacter sp. NPDC087344]|uniref:2-hydroxycarboxylate transporter family protein n=1 Tax=Glutamicibacter sp. NPDC087344 TaxID=3363994 RepID=UPI0038084B4D